MRAMGLLMLVTLAGCGPDAGQRDEERPTVPRDARVELRLGEVEPVEGSPFVTVPVLEWARDRRDGGLMSGSSYGSGPDAIERNRIILDERTLASRRLLPDDRLEVDRWYDALGAPSGGRDTGIVVGTSTGHATSLYAAVIARPAGEREGRTLDLLIGRFDTGAQRVVAAGLDAVRDVWVRDDGALLALVEVDGATSVRAYDARGLELLGEAPLAR